MKHNFNGFTLLELMVVVIIIAVLVAVALPQYKKTVLKSRFSKVMPVAKAVAEAQEVYYLGKNMYALDTNELDIIPSTGASITWATQTQDDQYNYVAAYRSDVPGVRYIVYQKNSPEFADTIHCEAAASADEENEAVWLCRDGLGGREIPGSVQPGNYRTFVLAGNEGSSLFSINQPACQDGDTSPSSMPVIHAGTSKATGTARCVNGQWQYEWSGGNEYSNWFGQCQALTAYGCAGSSFPGGNANCQANADYGCAGATFNGEESSCMGDHINGCVNATFSGSNAQCHVTGGDNSCAGSVFSGQGSACLAMYGRGCENVTIYPGAYCLSGKNSAGTSGCEGATYITDENGNKGCCGLWGEGVCPSGSPKCDYYYQWDGTYWE